MLRHELCQGTFQQFVSQPVPGADLGEVEQCVVQLTRIAAGHYDEQPPQASLLQRVKPPHRPEVDQRQLAVAEDQDVARMRVGVEGPFDHRLPQEAFQQPAGQPGPVSAYVVQHRARVPCTHPIQPFHHQDAAGRQRGMDRGDPDGSRAGHGRDVASLDPEVEFLA